MRHAHQVSVLRTVALVRNLNTVPTRAKNHDPTSTVANVIRLVRHLNSLVDVRSV